MDQVEKFLRISKIYTDHIVCCFDKALVFKKSTPYQSNHDISTSIIAADPGLVEVVLLGFSSCLDNLRHFCFSSWWQKDSSWNSWITTSGCGCIPWGILGLWSQLSCTCSSCPCWLGSVIFLCLCLRHQVPQLPKEMRIFKLQCFLFGVEIFR